MAKSWTLDELKAMSVHKRADLYRNACRLGHTADGAALKKLIEEAGLPYSEDAALTGDDPITLKMIEVIEPPRICRRPFGLSHAAIAGLLSAA